jgi:hypothetical protein
MSCKPKEDRQRSSSFAAPTKCQTATCDFWCGISRIHFECMEWRSDWQSKRRQRSIPLIRQRRPNEVVPAWEDMSLGKHANCSSFAKRTRDAAPRRKGVVLVRQRQRCRSSVVEPRTRELPNRFKRFVELVPSFVEMHCHFRCYFFKVLSPSMTEEPTYASSLRWRLYAPMVRLHY